MGFLSFDIIEYLLNFLKFRSACKLISVSKNYASIRNRITYKKLKIKYHTLPFKLKINISDNQIDILKLDIDIKNINTNKDFHNVWYNKKFIGWIHFDFGWQPYIKKEYITNAVELSYCIDIDKKRWIYSNSEQYKNIYIYCGRNPCSTEFVPVTMINANKLNAGINRISIKPIIHSKQDAINIIKCAYWVFKTLK